MRSKLWCLILWLTCLSSAWSAPKADILIFVDTRQPAQQAIADQLRHIFKVGRQQRGLSSEVLPIDTYDLKTEGHRLAAQRLHVAPSSLPYLALGQLDASGSPLRIVVGVDKVRDAEDGITRLNLAFKTASQEQSPIRGTWKQYVEMDGERIWLLTVRVSLVGNQYHYTLEDVSSRSNVQRIHITNTAVSATSWSFDSDWGADGQAHFELHPTSPDRYEGYSYLKGQRQDKNIWERVSP